MQSILFSTKNNILVIDDYAHHPTEMRATLNALKSAYPERRIILVFQPHRYSRTAKFAPEISKVLCSVDEAFLMPVYSAGEKNISGIDSQKIIDMSNGKIKNIDFYIHKLIDDIKENTIDKINCFEKMKYLKIFWKKEWNTLSKWLNITFILVKQQKKL